MLTSTTYNVASQPTTVNLVGSTETFAYDANSGRMTQWQSTATSYTQIGNLAWNANGTLQQVAITDPHYPQTCTHGYDDLARVKSANSGSIWTQTFTYDVFGNVNKSGSLNFSSQGGSGNHVQGFTYDAAGNVTNDGSYAYSYDAKGRPVSTGGTNLTFDAFAREAEIRSGSSYTQIGYAADGAKYAVMNGQTVQATMAPMVAGRQVVLHNGNGTGYFAHADWLGSARLYVGGNGTVSLDQAFAPFGETYAAWVNQSPAPVPIFTGQTQDVQPGLYDFLYRQQSSSQGRWLVPDPADLAAVDLTNPQTWNRYAYVANNPLSNIDPVGLDWDEGNGGLRSIFPDCFFNNANLTICATGSQAAYSYCVFIGLCGYGGSNNGGSAGGSNPPSTPPSNPPSNPPSKPVTFPNETNGTPRGINVNFGGPLGAILPSAICGDMGPCDPIGLGFGGGGNGPYHCDLLGNCYKLASDLYLPLRLFGTHWCGLGGAGRTLSGLDAACKAYDACYDAHGLSWATNWNPLSSPAQQGALQQCNQQLCNAARANTVDPGSSRVNIYFTNIVPVGSCQ